MTPLNPHNHQRYWTPDKIMNLIIGISIGLGLIWLMTRLSNVLLPFFAACLIAYLLNPIVEFFKRILHLRRRIIPVILTLFCVGLLLTVIGYLCTPMIAEEIDTLSNMVKHYIAHPDYSRWMPFIPDAWNDYMMNFDPSKITSLLDWQHLTALYNKGTTLLARSLESAMRIIEWLLMFIYIIFILIDYDQIITGFKKIFPKKIRPQAMTVCADVEQVMNSYFRGQGLVALCACVLYCIGFSIVGLPLALVMGILVGILYMIPYFQYITLIPIAIICLITSLTGDIGFWSMFGKCLLVYGISQSICDYIITPHIMGKEMGLNPAVILLALSIWGSLLGILGMIIALPVTALIIAYYERYISNR